MSERRSPTDEEATEALNTYLLPEHISGYGTGYENWQGERIVFIFSKESETKPSKSCIAEFDRMMAQVRESKRRIEELGARLSILPGLLGMPIPPFTESEKERCINTVKLIADERGYVLDDSWNGVGCHSLSVAIRRLGAGSRS